MNHDKRFPMIMHQIAQLVCGKCDEFIDVSHRLDEVDGICAGLNQLCDAMRERQAVMTACEDRLAELLRVVRTWSDGAQEERCPVGPKGDTIDQLAEVLNRMKFEGRRLTPQSY